MARDPAEVIEGDINRLKREMDREIRRMDAYVRRELAKAHVDRHGNIIPDDPFNVELTGRVRDALLAEYRRLFGSFPARMKTIGRNVVDASGAALGELGIDSGFTTVARDFLRIQAGRDLDSIAALAKEKSKDLREILIGLRSSTVDPAGATKRLVNELGTGLGRSVILIDTAASGLDRRLTTTVAGENGFDLFLYDGPRDSITRPWCAKRLGFVFTSEELDEEPNETGPQPPSDYGGGYNCRHRWTPLTLKAAKRYRRWSGRAWPKA